MMLFLSVGASPNLNTVAGQLCSVIIPPIFLYVGLINLFSRQYADLLFRKDTYSKNRVKVRLYAIIRRCIFWSIYMFAAVYFAIYGYWPITAILGIVVVAYGWRTLHVFLTRIEYTHRSVKIRHMKTTQVISYRNIKKISWEESRGVPVYVLVINCYDGTKINLSSDDYVGLVRLKEMYDSGKYRK